MSQATVHEGHKSDAAPTGGAGGTNILAILSLVFAFVAAPVGIVLGHLAKRQIRQTGEQGAGLAKAGLVLSYLFTGLSVLFFVIFVVLMANADPAATTAN
ncbi:DUF4190 domain-containing protein [Micromonospora yangpuensis]|uniref:DUF4190 domain-containing protein n=1 Tax=Micromonospora yangpuensis TaxID=683228 RepID=A0A1C6U0A1_9ACTN|nr:hypothetical protein GCM10012279_32550 [Micromonospora yangpuensis]SCL47466.1 protein of unknown function [Micromonospora yangpuensis]